MHFLRSHLDEYFPTNMRAASDEHGNVDRVFPFIKNKTRRHFSLTVNWITYFQKMY